MVVLVLRSIMSCFLKKTAFYEMSVLMRLSRMAQLSRATCTKWLTHTYKRRQTFLYSFCRKHCVNGDNREAKHSLVLSITHTGSNCAQQKSLTVPFKRQKPKTLQQLLTQRPSICSNREAVCLNLRLHSLTVTTSVPQPRTVSCCVAPSSGDWTRLQMKSLWRSNQFVKPRTCG